MVRGVSMARGDGEGCEYGEGCDDGEECEDGGGYEVVLRWRRILERRGVYGC